ncbi:WhiB family transcriptional regulator [Nocardia gipuzkoensis]|uniref:WhiB family transcriptional regulator n=1 Tax=Nocardia gipuzkoensis TaxID=2749991 RepID=UPI00237DD667|nr:WhiB family transcriptional regulator [Nocardia gipuzkoensis]MDE1674356.1 WhiB family transcriptional regulator [Nocardia gipuzkoensis]
MSIDLPDPVIYPDRACNGVDQNVFFPRGRQLNAIRRAQAICGGCPRLAECAAWAQPMAESGALVGCVVAAVYLPHGRTVQARRDTSAADLAYIAENGALPDQVEGAA